MTAVKKSVKAIQPRVVLEPDDFDFLVDHLSTYMPQYGCMHERVPKQISRIDDEGKRRTRNVLKYMILLHKKDKDTLEGVVSGPGIDIEYVISRAPVIEVRLIRAKADSKTKQAVIGRLVGRLKDKAKRERNYSGNFPVKRLPGQYYVKRGKPGTPSMAAKCQQAEASGDLSAGFLAKLEPWNFQLIFPGN